MRRTVVIIVLSFLATGCMVTRFAPFEPVESTYANLHIRVKLIDGRQYEFLNAKIESDVVSGRARGIGLFTVPMDQVRSLEQATGRAFDTATALRVIGITLTLTAIVVAACAIDKDCVETGTGKAYTGR